MKERRSRKHFINYESLKNELQQANLDLKRTSCSNVDVNEKMLKIGKRISELEAIISTEPSHPNLPPQSELIKITGVLEEFRIKKIMGYFSDQEYNPEAFSKQEKKEQFGALILSVLGNVTGAAVTAQSKVRESDPSDFIQGRINGIPFYGWLGMTNARQGDYVEMVVAPMGNHYEVYALANPQTRTLSIVPRCRQGINAYLKEGAKLGHIFVGVCFAFSAAPFFLIPIFTEKRFTLENYFWLFIFFILFDIFAYYKGRSLALKKVKPTIILAEMIFSKLGFNKPSDIDLDKITKNKLKELKEEDLFDRKDIDGRPLPGKHSWTEFFYYY